MDRKIEEEEDDYLVKIEGKGTRKEEDKKMKKSLEISVK